jgi:hypothetical protein
MRTPCSALAATTGSTLRRSIREQPTYPYGRALGCPDTLRGPSSLCRKKSGGCAVFVPRMTILCKLRYMRLCNDI